MEDSVFKLTVREGETLESLCSKSIADVVTSRLDHSSGGGRLLLKSASVVSQFEFSNIDVAQCQPVELSALLLVGQAFALELVGFALDRLFFLWLYVVCRALYLLLLCSCPQDRGYFHTARARGNFGGPREGAVVATVCSRAAVRKLVAPGFTGPVRCISFVSCFFVLRRCSSRHAMTRLDARFSSTSQTDGVALVFGTIHSTDGKYWWWLVACWMGRVG